MREPPIRWLEAVGAGDLALAGGAAVRLAVLRRHGLKTHEGFVVTTDAYRSFAEQNHLSVTIRQALARLRGRSLAETSLSIRERILGAPLPPDMREHVLAAAGTLLARQAGRRGLVVLPSPVDSPPDPREVDDTDVLYHGVGVDELVLAVRKCWAAGWRERSLRWYLSEGDAWLNRAAAVLVLADLQGRGWFRVWGVNPLSSDRRERLVESVGDELTILTADAVRGPQLRCLDDGQPLGQPPWPAVRAGEAVAGDLGRLLRESEQAQQLLGRTLRLDWTRCRGDGPPLLLRVEDVVVNPGRWPTGPGMSEAADRLVELMPQPPLPVARTGMAAHLGFQVRRRMASAGVALDGSDTWWRETEEGLCCRLPRAGSSWQRPLLPLRAAMDVPVDLQLATSLVSRTAAARERLQELAGMGAPREAERQQLPIEVLEVWQTLARAAGELAAAGQWSRQLLAWLTAGRRVHPGARLNQLLGGAAGKSPAAVVGEEPGGRPPPLETWPSWPHALPGGAPQHDGDAVEGRRRDSLWRARLAALWWQALWVEDVCGSALVVLEELARACLARMGRLLVEAGRLPSPDQLFFLEWDEVMELWTGAAERLSPLQVDTLPRRRDAWLRAFAVTDWHRFGLSPERLGQGWSGFPEQPVRGTAVWGGEARGPAAIVRDPGAAAALAPGAVAVLARTDPAVLQHLPQAGGYVFETEGRLSQLVLLARRCPAPIITGVRDATRRLAPGALLVVSGTRGSIRCVAQAQRPRAGWGGT